ncbi:MAG TPA: hypothetical protein VFS67_12170 [Polyangiaceae bacterium]|nr:hypothetical protein [Polyangiaceae bacterium]
MKPLAALLALALLVSAGPRPAWAAARQLNWHLVYQVAPGCPEADAFLARLDAQVAEGGSNYLDGRIVIVRISERGFRLRMQFNGGRTDELDGEDCAALVDAAVRTAGLARTDSPSEQVEALLRRNRERARAEQSSAAEASVIELSSTEALPALRAPARAPKPDAPEPPKAPAKGSGAAHWEPRVLGQGLYVSGALPRASLGAGLTLGVSRGGVQARIEATLWPSQPWTFLPGPRPVGVSLRQRSAAFALCSELLSIQPYAGRWSLNGCLRGALISLESLASADYGAGSTRYGTFGSRIGLAWEYGGLVVELLGGLDVAGGKSGLGPARGGASFVAQSSQLSAALALGWRWDVSGSGKDVAGAR